jgi:hypothetical protein
VDAGTISDHVVELLLPKNMKTIDKNAGLGSHLYAVQYDVSSFGLA